MRQKKLVEFEIDDTVVEISLETVVEKAMNEFENVTSVTIAHMKTYEEPTSIIVIVFTGEAGSIEEDLQLFTPDHRIAVNREEETVLAGFTAYATFDGPVTWDSKVQTTIYMSDDFNEEMQVQLKDGLAYVQDKLKYPEQWTPENPISLEQIRGYAD